MRPLGARRTRWSPTSRTGCPGPPRPVRAARGDPADGRSRRTSCSRAWVTDQYDRYVRGNTVSAQPADAGMVRVDEATGRGVAVATDCNARFVALDPYAGTQLALAEAYRNVATSGAVPQRRDQLPELRLAGGPARDVAVRARPCAGWPTAAPQLGIPVTGGNVSFYNQTGATAILPTPVVGVLGVIDDVAPPGAQRVRPRRRRDAAARRRPATSSAAASGRTSRTGTWAAARRRWTWPPSSGSPGCSPRPRPTGC